MWFFPGSIKNKKMKLTYKTANVLSFNYSINLANNKT